MGKCTSRHLFPTDSKILRTNQASGRMEDLNRKSLDFSLCALEITLSLRELKTLGNELFFIQFKHVPGMSENRRMHSLKPNDNS